MHSPDVLINVSKMVLLQQKLTFHFRSPPGIKSVVAHSKTFPKTIKPPKMPHCQKKDIFTHDFSENALSNPEEWSFKLWLCFLTIPRFEHASKIYG